MQEISSILITFFFSFFAALIFAPLVSWLQKKGVPAIMGVGVVIFVFILLIIILGFITTFTAMQLNDQIPAYEKELTSYMESLAQYVPAAEEISLNVVLREAGSSLVSFSVRILNGIVNSATTVMLIVIITAFLLLDSTRIPAKVQKELEEEFVLMAKLRDLSKVVMDYFMVRTKASLITGAGVAAFLLIGRIEFAIFWGIVVFIFSYIPYIGLFLASIPPIFLALLQYGPVGALAVIAAIIVVNILADNILFPSLAGRELKLAPSVVLLSIVYWVYVLGPVGFLISIPLTMSIKIVLESFKETEALAKMMDSNNNADKKASNEQDN
ncbi:MAG: AI-2E family transporter [Methanolobus sp.]|nr:AI-2E family transporter [Methanolobus sp.]